MLTKDTPYLDNRMLSLGITPEVHKALRHWAADKDTSVSQVVKTAIELYLKATAGHSH
jgi:predicted HicB family RNase H-like nuclease